MKQQRTENYATYEIAIEGMRVAQTEFELRRGEVVSARERLNRLRHALSDAETAAVDAKERWDEAFRESDGVLTPDMKHLRGPHRDAQDLAEDYRNLIAEAEAQVMHAELPALESARDIDSHRRRALSAAAEIELQKVVAESAPGMARALRYMEAANTPDNPRERAHTFFIEPEDTLQSALNNALKAIDPSSIELPEALRRKSITPLHWKDADSTFAILQRRKAAAGKVA